MGLSIYYSGRIQNYSDITNLTEEISDIAESLSWKYMVINDDHLKGILVTPRKCEPLVFTFIPDGRLCSPVNIMYGQPDDPYYYTIFTKTQFAGTDTHIAVIKLLRYIGKKFFADIKVTDEGKYWETNDEKILHEQFIRYDKALDVVTGMVSELKNIPGVRADALADRLEKLLKRKRDSI